MSPIPSDLYAPASEAPEDWAALQDELVRRAVALGGKTREIPGRLAAAGIDASALRSVADLAGVPVLFKDELPALQANDPPFGGMLAVPVSELLRVYASPGPILDPQGKGPGFFRFAPAIHAAGFRAGDIVLNSFSYHLTPGGALLEDGLRDVGCVTIPGGAGNTDAQIELARAAGARGFVGTPQFLLTLLERARDSEAGSLALERAVVTGAPLPPSLRALLQDEFGVDVYQAYGTADAGLLGYECAAKDGWHVAPGVVLEVVDPATGAAASPGTPGEVVVTSPNPVYPLLRFGTGDLSRFQTEPCTCGRTTARLAGYLGRVGAGVKVRGMFVHPQQLGRALGSRSDVNRFQARVGVHEHKDRITIWIEPGRGRAPDPQDLAEVVQRAIKVRPTVVLVPSGVIPDGAPVIVDERQLEPS